MDIKNLIELVRQFTLLWDQKDPRYSDNLASENAWATISTIADVSVEDCKATWKNVRDRYVKEHGLSTKQPARSQPYTVRWPFHKLCNFLDVTIEKRETVGNIKKVSQTSGYTLELWQDMQIRENGELKNEDIKDEEPSNENIFNTTAITSTEPAKSQKIDKKKYIVLEKDRNETRKTNVKAQEIDQFVEKLIKVGDSIEQLVNKLMKEGTETEDQLFGLLVAASLSKIHDSRRKLRIKAKILSLLADEGI